MSERLERILYLEDDPIIAELALMAMQDLGGLTVCHCSSGQEAIAAAPGFAPQLLLFDVMVPDLDGPQTFGRITGLPTLTYVPVIFMTAKAQTHQERGYMALGACGVIGKPFDPLTLSDQVQSLWSAAPTSHSASS
jgi:CheY-like chemotaxis protein